MKSVQIQFTSRRRAELVPYELADTPPPGHALVETEYSIISPGTEGSLYIDLVPSPFPGQESRPVSYPRSTGYGNLGRVISVAPGVTSCQPGDRVLSFSSHSRHVHAAAGRMAMPVPADAEGRRIVFARMAGVGIAALRSSTVQAGDRALVLGLGLVGNLAAQILRLAGIEVLCADLSPFRVEKARACGLEHAIDLSRENLADAVAHWNHGERLPCVVDATGHSGAIADAVVHVGQFGELILLGSPRASEVRDLTPFLFHVHRWNIRVIGALEWGWPQHATPRARDLDANYRNLIGWIHQERIVVDPLLTRLASPSDCQEAYTRLVDRKDEELAVVFDWSRLDSK